MNLETEPAPIKYGPVNMIVVGESQQTPRHFFAFDVNIGGLSVEYAPIVASVVEGFNCVYSLRGFSEERPFTEFRQSRVNMIGSVRESVEMDMRYALWAALTQIGGPGDGWSLRLAPKEAAGHIGVAVDGSIYHLTPRIELGEHYSDTCETCQNGRMLLQMALNDLNGGLVLDAATFDGVTYAYGNGRYIPTPGESKLHISNIREYPEGIAGFTDWFRDVNRGAIDMSHADVTFFVA